MRGCYYGKTAEILKVTHLLAAAADSALATLLKHEKQICIVKSKNCVLQTFYN